MKVSVTFRPVRGKRQWLAAAVKLRDTMDLLIVGFIRFSEIGRPWVARPRAHQDRQTVPVRAFPDRRDAVAWLLAIGGYVREGVA